MLLKMVGNLKAYEREARQHRGAFCSARRRRRHSWREWKRELDIGRMLVWSFDAGLVYGLARGRRLETTQGDPATSSKTAKMLSTLTTLTRLAQTLHSVGQSYGAQFDDASNPTSTPPSTKEDLQ